MTRRLRLLLLLGLVGVLLACQTFSRIVTYGPSGIDDYRIFAGRTLSPGAQPRPFFDRSGEGLLPETLQLGDSRPLHVASFVEKNKTVAFLVVHRGELLTERYFRGFSRDSLVQVFSVTKSVTSLLVGAAIQDGYFKGLNQPVTDWVPELEPNGFRDVTLGHLLNMTSGMDYCESDNPFGMHPALYYGEDIVPALLKLKLQQAPGTRYRYKSGDTQLLGLALARALHPATITDYAQRRIWEPLGMEYGGFWATDHAQGLEKTFCCLSMRARDLAKVGVLVANGGRVGEDDVFPRDWIEALSAPGGTADAPPYALGWWRLPELEGGLMGSGHLGQYLIVLPDYGLVLVRLGIKGGIGLRDHYARLAVALGKHLDARR